MNQTYYFVTQLALIAATVALAYNGSEGFATFFAIMFFLSCLGGPY